ncbi:MAG: hypothetical protein DBY45_07530 [Clostridiales bacterium]|nr:MAG: hypothetical protein DBY45_07530 [Clostridiales bacterium]
MNDNQTINVTAQLDSGESARQIRSALSDIQKNLSPIQVSVTVDTSGAAKQLQDIQKQFAAVSASANAAAASQESFLKKTQNTGKNILSVVDAAVKMNNLFPKLSGISTEYALFPQVA